LFLFLLLDALLCTLRQAKRAEVIDQVWRRFDCTSG